MQQYQLADIYNNLRRTVAAGQEAEAARWLGEVLGVPLPSRLPPADPRVQLEPMLTYRGFKPAELAMLAEDLKPVVKFEDLPVDVAEAFRLRHRDHYRLATSAPYRKDYLLLRSRPAQASAPDARVTVYASRGDAGARLRQIESQDREDVLASGELLGFPRCCIEAFAADFDASRRDQDTLNDDASRRLLTTGTRHTATWHEGEPGLHPLTDLELLGFYPCRLDCPRALAVARRNLGALLRARPALQPVIEQRLRRPLLFWRLPFFAALEGRFEGPAFVLEALRVNVFPDPAVRRIQAFFAAHLGAWFAGVDRVLPTEQGLALYQGERQLRMLPSDPRQPPLLTSWRPWPVGFFDPGRADSQPTRGTT